MENGEENQICRLCLSGGDSLIYIFKQNAAQLCITEVLRNFLRIEVCEGDGYPPWVCLLCFNKLTDIKQFREQCVHSKHTYDSLKDSAHLNQSTTNHQLLELPTEVKKESDDSLENEYDSEQLPLDIVKTELTEEEGVFSVGSSEDSSLPLSSPDYQEDSQQQLQLGVPESASTHLCIHKAAPCKYKCAQYEMALRLWKDRVRQARRRAMESEEERQRRLAQDRERTRARRAKESPEEKARRLERARVYMAEKRRRLVAMVAMETSGVYDN